MATWLAVHGVFAGYAITGRGWVDRRSDAFLHWLDLGLFGLVLVAVDVVFLWGLWHERKNKNA